MTEVDDVSARVENISFADRHISSLCENHYADLKRYFGTLTVSDLSVLREDDMVDAAKKEDKLLMRAFICAKLGPYLNVPNPFKELQPFFPPNADVCVEHDKRGLLDLSHRVLRATGYARRDPTRIPIDAVFARIPKDDVGRVQTLRLVGNGLADDDFERVLALVRQLPACRVVDLRTNNFVGANASFYANVREMLHLPQVAFVDVTLNPFASSAHIDFFTSLTENEASKLVFVPKAWLDSLSWRCHFPPRLCAIVARAHARYYGIDESP